LRRTKLDELPQLFNVLIGDMSLVGPRPDTAQYAALLGDDDPVLSVRPGLTGPATLFFIDEQEVLAQVENPESYSRDVIFPAKVMINRQYVENGSVGKDLLYVAATLFAPLRGPTIAACRNLLATAHSPAIRALRGPNVGPRTTR
jgi:lipopolysaccharide/colanic/teichoic acid biosynthesis glycosyltransferase